MTKLVLDTCSWLDLAKPRFKEAFDDLEAQVRNEQIELLTTDIIIEEWDRNKERILKEIIHSIRDNAKNAIKMAEYLPLAEQADLNKIIKKYKDIEKNQEDLAKTYLSKIESFLKASPKFTVSDDVKLKMAERALTKKAPFHNNKNNMADALIFFGAKDYLKAQSGEDTKLIFVTINYTDFCKGKGDTSIHPDLDDENVVLFNNVAQALDLSNELIEDMEAYHESLFNNWIDLQIDIARGK